MTFLILSGSILVPALLTLCGLLAWRWVRSLDRRRSPLTIPLLNLPGEGLRKRIAGHEEKFSEAAAMMALSGPILLSAWLLMRFDRTGVAWRDIRIGTGDLLLAVILGVMLCWVLWRLIHNARARRQALDGLHAELAVAQCLTPLIAEGAMVFHDFPTERGNIDHIVIGASVVFAIETKSRRKPAEKGSSAARVRYDGQQLFFPHHTETLPIEQAAWQARWLEGFLRGAGAEGVRVVPVLALPGWFTERTNREARASVLVSNCHNPLFMMSEKFGPRLSEPQRRHVAHVLTRHYPPPEGLSS